MVTRKRSCGCAIPQIMFQIDELRLTRPEYLATKALLISPRESTEDGVCPVVSSLDSNIPMSPECLQTSFCANSGLSCRDFKDMIASMVKGSLPRDVAMLRGAVADRIIWFALDPLDKLLVVDITNWTALPNVRFGQMSVCKYFFTSKARARSDALHRLSDAIDAVTPRLSSQEALDVYDRLKEVHALG